MLSFYLFRKRFGNKYDAVKESILTLPDTMKQIVQVCTCKIWYHMYSMVITCTVELRAQKFIPHNSQRLNASNNDDLLL